MQTLLIEKQMLLIKNQMLLIMLYLFSRKTRTLKMKLMLLIKNEVLLKSPNCNSLKMILNIFQNAPN